jgi:hypothetical protein
MAMLEETAKLIAQVKVKGYEDLYVSDIHASKMLALRFIAVIRPDLI